MIIGIVGTHAAGKGAVVGILKEYGFKHLSVSDVFLANEAERRGLTPDRKTRRDIANEYRAKGPTALMEAVLEAAGGDAEGDIILEALHTEAEVQFVQQRGGFVFAVDADPDIRYARIQRRGSAKDNISYEQFLREQQEEMESDDPNKNNLLVAMATADYTIVNNGDYEELRAQIAGVLDHIEED